MWKPDQHKIPAPAKSADEDALVPLPELDIPEGVTSLGRTIAVTGVLHAAEHLIIEGKFKGELTILDHGLAVGKHATVDAQVMARTISVRGRTTGTLTASEKVEIHRGGTVDAQVMARTISVRGRTTGTLTASEKVEIHLGGNVEGRIVTTRLAIEEGALFNGSVDPKRTEAALAVHRHRLKQQG